MSPTTSARLAAAMATLAPVVLLVGSVAHPYLATPDAATVADAAAADTTRWGLAHLAIGAGYGLLIVAFLAIRGYVRDAGEERWSGRALPLIALGSTLFAILTGMEFAPLAAAETGGDGAAAQEALLPWFLPVLATGALSFALGAFGFARSIALSRVLSPPLTRLVVGALVAMAVARFVPVGAAQYVIGAAGVAALWPLAAAMWKQPAMRWPGGGRRSPGSSARGNGEAGANDALPGSRVCAGVRNR